MPEHTPLLRKLIQRLYHIDTDNAYIMRRARGLLSIYLASMPLPFIFAFLSWQLAAPERQHTNNIILCCLGASQLLGTWLAKSARVDAGSFLVSTILSLAIGGYMIMLKTYTNFIWFMILSVIIASINVRPTIIWVSAALNIAITLVLIAIIPSEAVGVSVKVFTNVMLISLILLVALITYTTATLTNTLLKEQQQTLQQLKQAKEELAHALDETTEEKQRAEAASRTKSSFLANMSHELRTPLNAIIGYSELLQEDIEDEASNQDLQKIERSGRHLLSLINDILDLSKVEAGKMVIERSQVSLDELAHELQETLTTALKRQGNTLRVQLPTPAPTLHTDRMRLKQILLNLLSNACKFTEEGLITLRITQDSTSTRIDIIDSGIGMSEDALSRVFEEFVQADDSTTRKYGGTGLGLPLSHKMAELLGGSLVADSTLGQGSTFTLTLPHAP